MALPTHRYSYQQQQQGPSAAVDSIGAPLDTKAYSFDDDNAAILDSSVLDPDMMQNPSIVQFRKDSFAHADGMLSPVGSQTWDAQYHDPRHFKAESTPYLGAMQPQHHMEISHTSMPAHWNMAPASGSGTPNTALDIMPPPTQHTQFDNVQYAQAKAMEFDQRQHDPRFMSAIQVPTPMSTSGTEWMALAQSEVEQRQLSKRLRSDSPSRGVYDIRRDAGIQKKNKRIDIPQERNIQTIDQMIESTKDEDLLKELKAQKRLLRNREAALASRQRKKKHTEDLESKEKGHQNQLTMLEQQIDAVSIQRDELDRQRLILLQRNDEAQRFIEALQMEKRDMRMKFNEETASLRRKVQVLTEKLESVPTNMSAAPSSTGFTDFSAEMEALHMGQDWDNFLFMGPHDDAATELDQATPRNDIPRAATLDRTPTGKPAEQPVASSMIFMLLLFGAFMASKPANTTSVDIPSNVRAAAPGILKDLLADGTNDMQSVRMDVHPSSMQVAMPQRSANRMTQMHRRLTTPTFQQKLDHAFALTPSQYASHTNAEIQMNEHPSPLPPRRALIESRLPHENKADIYTRSLLWEHIPTEVVNQFKELVRDHHELTKQDGLQQQQSSYHDQHI